MSTSRGAQGCYYAAPLSDWARQYSRESINRAAWAKKEMLKQRERQQTCRGRKEFSEQFQAHSAVRLLCASAVTTLSNARAGRGATIKDVISAATPSDNHTTLYARFLKDVGNIHHWKW